MAHLGQMQWTGKSQKKYSYWLYPLGTKFTAVPGNYGFIKKTPENKWSVVYFGETGDMSVRFDNHHKMDCAKKNGATHICVHGCTDDDDAARRAEESDLIDNYKPICND